MKTKKCPFCKKEMYFNQAQISEGVDSTFRNEEWVCKNPSCRFVAHFHIYTVHGGKLP